MWRQSYFKIYSTKYNPKVSFTNYKYSMCLSNIYECQYPQQVSGEMNDLFFIFLCLTCLPLQT